MDTFNHDSPPGNTTLGELRRFELMTEDKEDIAELKRVISEKGLSRNDLAIILFNLRVRPGFSRSDFGI